MKLTTRLSSYNFIEITTNESEVTIFKTSTAEIDDLINNLKEVIEDLETLKES